MLNSRVFRNMVLWSILGGTVCLCQAATKLVLFNGNTFTGTIVSESDNAIVLSVNGSSLSIMKAMVSKREEVPDSRPAAPEAQPAAATAAPVPKADSVSAETPAAAPAPAPAPVALPAAPPAVPVVPAVSEAVPLKKFSLFLNFASNENPNYTWNYKTRTGNQTTNYSLIAMVGIGLQPKKLVEIRPAIGLLHSTYTYVPSDSNGEIKTGRETVSDWGLVYELGFYFHLVNSEFFGFSLGPDLYVDHYFSPLNKTGSTEVNYANYYDITAALGIPLNLDLKVAQFFSFRLIMNFINFNAHVMYSNDTKDATTFDRSSLDINFDISTQWVPTIGFVFVF
jgi:hypothetical protein